MSVELQQPRRKDRAAGTIAYINQAPEETKQARSSTIPNSSPKDNIGIVLDNH
jgi:hypothetical protein